MKVITVASTILGEEEEMALFFVMHYLRQFYFIPGITNYDMIDDVVG